jgi:hypothetical protein
MQDRIDRRMDETKLNRRDTGYECGRQMAVAQDCVEWRLVFAVTNYRFPLSFTDCGSRFVALGYR